ncbi:hypothetical protein B0H13DRAFT_2352949 [Mycena leptocephala]|nr:hypothetical protein B0H13DRAFT_2352949 [Mycena leptocephala]
MSSNAHAGLGNLPTTSKGTRHRIPPIPRKRKTPAADLRTGLNNLKETLQDVKARIKQRLNLDWSLDDWQGEMIRRLRKGYDGIFVAGTGYGKSIVFEGLAALNKNKMVMAISPLKALKRDQVSPLTRARTSWRVTHFEHKLGRGAAICA